MLGLVGGCLLRYQVVLREGQQDRDVEERLQIAKVCCGKLYLFVMLSYHSLSSNNKQ